MMACVVRHCIPTIYLAQKHTYLAVAFSGVCLSEVGRGRLKVHEKLQDTRFFSLTCEMSQENKESSTSVQNLTLLRLCQDSVSFPINACTYSKSLIDHCVM